MQRNLVPGKVLIDDRTEPERLAFLAEFASLINFYNGANTLTGDWRPFLLKDPVFLMASISQVRFEYWNTLYRNACLKVQREVPLTLDSRDLGYSFNELFDQFTNVFLCMERWTHYMVKMQDEYELRTYMLGKVQDIFGPYLWALVSFKEAMYITRLVPHLAPVPLYRFDVFYGENYNPVWVLNKDKNPYWDVLGLDQDITKNSADQLFGAFKRLGDELFSFFHTIISHAGPQYDKLSAGISKYADTTLLRTFISLLQVQQDQLNTLSEKHLEFYYHDILKQHKNMAVPDQVIIATELAKKDAAFELPAGTVFEAGLDPDKNPIEFVNTEAVALNPAAITAACTLSRLPVEESLNMLDALYFHMIPDPGTLKKAEDGSVMQWETFGGGVLSPGNTEKNQISMAVSFASPMFLLREGERNVMLTMTFEQDADMALLYNAEYYMSTATGWLKVPAQPAPGLISNQAVIQIPIDTSLPAIEKFTTDPDGLTSEWPMFKMVFWYFCNMDSPPVLTDLTIDVSVKGVKNLQQYNDDGLLVTKTPYQLFGPLPVLNSHFIIGSNEIFSKPVTSLVVQLHWDNLPPSLAEYYRQYNDYICGRYETIQPELPILPAAKSQTGFSRFTGWLGSLFKKKEAPEAVPMPPPARNTTGLVCPDYFTNFSFTVDFQLLEQQQWNGLDMIKEMPGTVGAQPWQPYSTPCTDSPSDNSGLLFSTDAYCDTIPYSYFGYNGAALDANPYLQNTPLVFTDTTASGFMRMTLNNPGYGFGSALYPQLISEIALQNGLILVDALKTTDLPPFYKPAVVPYVPQLLSCTADYSAHQEYDLTKAIGDYPLQCFFYSPFESYPVYSNTPDVPGLQNSAGLTLTGIVWARSGLQLFPKVDNAGTLFLFIENLVPADSLSIFFELSRKYGESPDSRDIHYNYLSTTGWKELNILSNDTNNFTCSGIIKTNIPTDIAGDSMVFPGKKYWFAIGVRQEPGSFADTVYLKTNGFPIWRCGADFLTSTEKPWLPANAVTQTKLPVPQIAIIAQPFPSEGGRAAETETTMNRRVSNRLKTKDRVVTAEDYFRLIRQEFDDIYYSKVIYNKEKRTTDVYVVKSYDSSTDANAFIPLVSECREGKIRDFLRDRASAFAKINVSNFNIEYVRVTARVIIREGYEQDGVRRAIINAINIYLSPWILSAQQQIAIDQGLSDAELATVIKNVAGVLSVESIYFQTGLTNDFIAPFFVGSLDQQGRVVKPARPSNLFVPFPEHNISFNP